MAEEGDAAAKATADKAIADKAAAEKVAADAAAKAAADKSGESKNPLDEAKQTLKEIKEQNILLEENLKKVTKVAADFIISGKTEAGRADKTAEDLEVEAARDLIKGSGFEDRLFPQKKS